MYDNDKEVSRDIRFDELIEGIEKESEGSIGLQLVATILAMISYKTVFLLSNKIAHEKAKERINTKLAILEYTENAKNKKNFYTPNDDEENRIVERITTKDPSFNKEIFEHYVEDVFRKLMISFVDNNLDYLRKYVDANILEVFKIQASKNALTPEIEKLKIEAINYIDLFGYHNEGNLEIISLAVGVNYYDFATDKDGKVVQGSDTIMRRSVYLLSFARKIGSKTINNIKDYKDGVAYCPNCGGKITNSYSECEYCHTILYNGTDNWLLTHIEEM